ncbi:MAG TPA: GxxExxY protein [Prolixibacteraceae bacterium]|nr:GxxExxY protein [Prolixibacteraceae bacterium]
MVDILFKDESYAIIGACIKVHSELGAGFLEAVYQEALEKEFAKRNIPFQRQPKLSLFFDGEKLKKYYIADFLCYDSIVLEIKALSFLSETNIKQLQNSLKASKQRLGLLINFGTPSLIHKRILNPIR